MFQSIYKHLNKWMILSGATTLCVGIYFGVEGYCRYIRKKNGSKLNNTNEFSRNESEQMSPSFSSQEKHPYSVDVYSFQNVGLTKIERSKVSIYRICITGGPFCGKSTSIEHLNEKLS